MVRSAEPVGAVPPTLGPPSPLSLHTAGFHTPASDGANASLPAVELKMLALEEVVGEETECARERERSSCEDPPDTFAREVEEEGEKMVEEGLERVLDCRK